MNVSYEYARIGLIANAMVLLVAQFLPDVSHVWVEKGLIVSGAVLLSLASRCPVTDDVIAVRRKNRLVRWAVVFLVIVVVKVILLVPMGE